MRSFVYGGVATLLALLIAYPLAYAIALRAGRWRNVLLFAVIAPFFTTYLIRTLGVADDPLRPERRRRLPRLARAARLGRPGARHPGIR